MIGCSVPTGIRQPYSATEATLPCPSITQLKRAHASGMLKVWQDPSCKDKCQSSSCNRKRPCCFRRVPRPIPFGSGTLQVRRPNSHAEDAVAIQLLQACTPARLQNVMGPDLVLGTQDFYSHCRKVPVALAWPCSFQNFIGVFTDVFGDCNVHTVLCAALTEEAT